MKNIIWIALVSFLFASCGDEVNEADITIWRAINMGANVTALPIIIGPSNVPDFDSDAENIDYELELNYTTGKFKLTGSYSMRSVFTSGNFPDILSVNENINKSGNFIREGDVLTFDGTLYDVYINELKWTEPEGEELSFALRSNGNELLQYEQFFNLKIQDDMASSMILSSKWEKQ